MNRLENKQISVSQSLLNLPKRYAARLGLFSAPPAEGQSLGLLAARGATRPLNAIKIGSRSIQLPSWGLAFGGLLLLTIVLWLPFGLRIPGTYEEWGILLTIRHGVFSDPFIPNRPLMYLPWFLANVLTPGSFIGLNLLMAGSRLATGFLMYLLVQRLLPGNRALAFAIGALALAYPSDAGLMDLRTTNIHFTVALFLVALHLLILYWERGHWPTLVGMVAVEAIGLLTYEAAIPLMFFSPVLLVWLQKGMSKRIAKISAVWYLLPCVSFFLLIRSTTFKHSYATKIVADATFSTDPSGALGKMWASITNAYSQNFVVGWTDAANQLTSDTGYLALAILAVMVVVCPILWFYLRNPEIIRTSKRSYLILIAIGFATIFLGFALYLPTAFRNSNWRVFLYAFLGAAICVGIGCFLISQLFGKWQPVVFTALIAVLVGLSLVHTLNQHKFYFDSSQRQQRILAQIVEQAPIIKPKTKILIIDKAPYLTWKAWPICADTTDCMTTMLQYIYPNKAGVSGATCTVGYRPRGKYSEDCMFLRKRATLSFIRQGSDKLASMDLPYESTLIFESSENGVRLLKDLQDYQPNAVGYHPERNLLPGDPPSSLYSTFTNWPFKSDIASEQRTLTDSVRMEFDQLIQFGEGWSFPQDSLAWTNAPTSTIDLILKPDLFYAVKFRVKAAMSQEILNSLTLKANDKPIHLAANLDSDNGFIYEGVIPKSAVGLDHDNTRLKFSVSKVMAFPGDDGPQLGVQFDWLDIKPMNPQPAPADTVRLDFDQPIAGDGWDKPANSQMWTNAPTSDLNVWMKPTQSYSIAFRVAAGMSQEIVDSLHLSVNDKDIALSFSRDEQNATIFRGIIPRSAVALDGENTRLKFTVSKVLQPAGDMRHLGVLFDWLDIKLMGPPPSPTDSLRLDFDQPMQAGSGWGDPLNSQMWTTATTSDLDLWLNQDRSHQIKFRISAGMSQAIVDSLALSVNDQPVKITRDIDKDKGFIYHGTIPQSAIALDGNNTRLKFTISKVVKPDGDPRSLGVVFDWLEITP